MEDNSKHGSGILVGKITATSGNWAERPIQMILEEFPRTCEDKYR